MRGTPARGLSRRRAGFFRGLRGLLRRLRRLQCGLAGGRRVHHLGGAAGSGGGRWRLRGFSGGGGQRGKRDRGMRSGRGREHGQGVGIPKDVDKSSRHPAIGRALFGHTHIKECVIRAAAERLQHITGA